MVRLIRLVGLGLEQVQWSADFSCIVPICWTPLKFHVLIHCGQQSSFLRNGLAFAQFEHDLIVNHMLVLRLQCHLLQWNLLSLVKDVLVEALPLLLGPDRSRHHLFLEPILLTL